MKFEVYEKKNSAKILLDDGGWLEGILIIPPDAKGIVIFAHGSGSSRFSPRNRYVAEQLQKARLATLLLDLLTKEEERIDIRTTEFRFNIKLLSDRLIQANKWIKKNGIIGQLNIGYFGSSTGAAAALIAAATQPKDVHAIVSRGGRTDLAENYVQLVEAPTLLIAGSDDVIILKINTETMKHLRTEKNLKLFLVLLIFLRNLELLKR